MFALHILENMKYRVQTQEHPKDRRNKDGSLEKIPGDSALILWYSQGMKMFWLIYSGKMLIRWSIKLAKTHPVDKMINIYSNAYQ